HLRGALPSASGRPSQANGTGSAPSDSSSSRRTVAPAASTISTVSGPEASARISPDIPAPLARPTVSASTSASWPTSAAARRAWSDSITLAIEPMAACMSPMPWTVENCASCPRNWVLSSGLSGSWCLSCSVIRRRKSAWPRLVSRCGAWAARAPQGLSLRVLPIAVIAGSGQGSLAHPERGGGQLAGGVEDLDVGLVAARGGDHVDHLRDRVDGGGIDVAVAIGERVAGLVASDRRGPGFGDLQHAHARQFRFAGDRGRGEHRLQRAVDLVRVAGDRIGVGQVAGHRAQPDRLGGHGAGGDIEDRQVAHARAPYCPVIAVSIPRTLDSTKDIEARYSSAAWAKLARARSGSTVLPSRLGCEEGASCRAAATAAASGSVPGGCTGAVAMRRAALKSRSWAWNPGVSALAMLAASTCRRCSR